MICVHRRRRALRGLSLLELLVALSIMALAVGVLYRVLGASVRNVSMLQDQQRAVLLAQSLLAAKDAVAPEGWSEAGESAGYGWQVRSQPYGPAPAQPGTTPLHEVVININWTDGDQPRQIQLRTLRPQRRPVVLTAGAGS